MTLVSYINIETGGINNQKYLPLVGHHSTHLYLFNSFHIPTNSNLFLLFQILYKEISDYALAFQAVPTEHIHAGLKDANFVIIANCGDGKII